MRTLLLSLLLVGTMHGATAQASPIVQVESYSHPTLYAISDDGCMISEMAHRALCWEDGEQGLVLYAMHRGQDPSEWVELSTTARACVRVNPRTNRWGVVGGWAHGSYRDMGDHIQYGAPYGQLIYPVRRLIREQVEGVRGTGLRVACVNVPTR